MAGTAQSGGETGKVFGSQDLGGVRSLLIASAGGLLTAVAIVGLLGPTSISPSTTGESSPSFRAIRSRWQRRHWRRT